MTRALLLVSLSLGCAVAHADIYKCTDYYGTQYQSWPCAPGQAQTLVQSRRDSAPPPVAAMQPRALPPATSNPGSSVRGRDLAFRRTTIGLGVSDDEVLNMPGWGVPDRIERAREGRIYKETWMYALPNGATRWLYFANARLTGMETERGPSDYYAGVATR
jgi:hypothetical protein